MKAEGVGLVARIERETPRPGPGCVLTKSSPDVGPERYETPEIEQTWIPEEVPPLPAMVWCFSHRRWELKQEEETGG